MGIGIIASPKPGHHPMLHIQQKVDNTPRMELVKIGHIGITKTLKPLDKAGSGAEQVGPVLTFCALAGWLLGGRNTEGRSQLRRDRLKVFQQKIHQGEVTSVDRGGPPIAATTSKPAAHH
jgi:hypothetical protein